MKKIATKVLANKKKADEAGARKQLLEELFNDFNRSRGQIYRMNFIRGIMFGVGSVIGGTLVVALILWILSLLADIPGGLGDFIQFIVDTVEKNDQQ